MIHFGGNIDLSNRAEVAMYQEMPRQATSEERECVGEAGLSSGLESTAKWLEYPL